MSARKPRKTPSHQKGGFIIFPEVVEDFGGKTTARDAEKPPEKKPKRKKRRR